MIDNAHEPESLIRPPSPQSPSLESQSHQIQVESSPFLHERNYSDGEEDAERETTQNQVPTPRKTTPETTPKKQILVTQLNKDAGPYMEIKPWLRVNRKSELMRFLNAYNLPGLKDTGVKNQKKVTKRLNLKDLETPKYSESTGTGSTLSSSSGSASDSSSRRYDTRSKKRARFDDEDGDEEYSRENSDDKGLPNGSKESEKRNDSRVNKSEAFRRRIKSPNGCRLAPVSNSHKLTKTSSKEEFVKYGTVQYIHDSQLELIPNFEPSFSSITQSSLGKAIRRIGLKGNSSGIDIARYPIEFNERCIIDAVKLTPQQYIDTKRRFFAEKARKTYNDFTFKKTDAQKACKIDVNKASKLYEVFQSCGLLEDRLFKLT